MLTISKEQYMANLRNAQKSTGPKTEKGKEAVRFNGLRHALRAEATILPGEKAEDYIELHADLTKEWEPGSPTETMLVEQMALAHWFLRRMAAYERKAFIWFESGEERQMRLLDRFSVQRSRLERSFSKTMHDLIHLQKHRATKPQAVAPDVRPQQPEAAQPQPEVAMPRPPAPDPRPPQQEPAPAYMMSPDTR